MKKFILIAVTALVFTLVCNAQTTPFFQEGTASWYGTEFDGQITASGEVFTSSGYTAAHPTLPFGTLLTITNKNNNKKVTVRVNDRGPFIANRAIDLSKAAAEYLEITMNNGTAPVSIIIAEAGAVPGPVVTQTPSTPTVTAAPPLPTPSASLDPAPPTVQTPSTPAVTAAPPLPTPPASLDPAPTVQTPSTPAVTAAPPLPAPPAVQTPSTPTVTAAPPLPTPPVVQTPSTPAVTTPSATLPAPAARTAKPAVIKPAAPPTGTNKRYRLQVGAFKTPKNAVAAFDKLKSIGLSPAYERSGEWYRVVLSGIKADDVRSIAEKIGQAGFPEALIREEP
jgi:rare lipoprotein A